MKTNVLRLLACSRSWTGERTPPFSFFFLFWDDQQRCGKLWLRYIHLRHLRSAGVPDWFACRSFHVCRRLTHSLVLSHFILPPPASRLWWLDFKGPVFYPIFDLCFFHPERPRTSTSPKILHRSPERSVFSPLFVAYCKKTNPVLLFPRFYKVIKTKRLQHIGGGLVIRFFCWSSAPLCDITNGRFPVLHVSVKIEAIKDRL